MEGVKSFRKTLGKFLSPKEEISEEEDEEMFNASSTMMDKDNWTEHVLYHNKKKRLKYFISIE